MNMRQAQALFGELNSRYFRGRLPPHRVRFLPPSAPDLLLGVCAPRRRTIWLCRGLGDATTPSLRQVLLHEMCHIGSLAHGRAWQRKMRGLADRGEAWARDEARRYAGVTAPAVALFVEHVEERLEELSWGEDGIGWRAALGIVTAEFGLSRDQVLSFAPGVRAKWRKLLAEQRQRDALPADFFPEPFDREER